ncbi:hypothetical protein [Ralstonia pseudosolanacearum]|uniref:hypothetical protein n=1 Tax=Ralstonia pseudosolanacearum TaxID=1310165 RepID=UPI003CF18150
MSQRISILVALDGADEGLKRALTSAEPSLGELAAGDRAAAGLAQVKVGVFVISEQITTARTQLCLLSSRSTGPPAKCRRSCRSPTPTS